MKFRLGIDLILLLLTICTLTISLVGCYNRFEEYEPYSSFDDRMIEAGMTGRDPAAAQVSAKSKSQSTVSQAGNNGKGNQGMMSLSQNESHDQNETLSQNEKHPVNIGGEL
jgi:hypothetical protein